MNKIVYKPFRLFQRGDIAALLKTSYADWKLYDAWSEQWEAYDADVFDYPDSVGACGFVTTVDDTPVGMFSWDPRTRPYVIIGHNCIIPAFRKQGLGAKQLNYALQLFKEQNFGFVRVSTEVTDYFYAARRMYEGCGFVECKPYRNDGDGMIYYEKELIANSDKGDMKK